MENMKLFNEVMAEIKELKLFNESVAAEVDERLFDLQINTNLLHPTFEISEGLGGSIQVKGIAFDKDVQEFFIKDSGEVMEKSEVIQHVNRGLVQFVTPGLIDFVESIMSDIKKIEKVLEDFRTPKYIDVVEKTDKVNDALKLIVNSELDYYVGIYEAETIEERRVIDIEYTEILEGAKTHLEELHGDLQALIGKCKVSPISKLMALLR